MKKLNVKRFEHYINTYVPPWTLNQATLFKPYPELTGRITFWHRIVPMTTPRMASSDPPQTEPYTFQGSPFLDGINHILAARWSEPAIGPKHWRQCQLVKADGKNKEFFKHASESIAPGTFSRLENGVILMTAVHPDIHDVALIFV